MEHEYESVKDLDHEIYNQIKVANDFKLKLVKE